MSVCTNGRSTVELSTISSGSVSSFSAALHSVSCVQSVVSFSPESGPELGPGWQNFSITSTFHIMKNCSACVSSHVLNVSRGRGSAGLCSGSINAPA